MATIKDIAKYAGVSIGTVDRALHDRGRVNAETKQKIEEAVAHLHYTPNHVAQGLALNKKNINLCFFVPDACRNPFYADILAAAKEQKRRLQQYGVNVQILILKMLTVETEYDPSIFPAAYAKAAAEADGIAMPGIPYPGLTECATALQEKKMPLVFYNSQDFPLEHMAYVGCDYQKAGRLAAGMSALIGGDDAKVAIFSQGLNFYNADKSHMRLGSFESRIAGFRQEMAVRYPQMQILGYYDIDQRREVNTETVRQALRDHPEMKIAYVVNPADYEICEIIREQSEGRTIRIITNDLVGRQIGMVESGVISATICQEPEKQGSLPLDILFQYLAYGKRPKQEDCYTKLSIHIAQNVI
ncbi:MAG: substrate-binding domain-containing protein [Pygmaiobacter sp.]|nr:substrate-binding domain-containing protein [Pygmaiobacter sp.]